MKFGVGLTRGRVRGCIAVNGDLRVRLGNRAGLRVMVISNCLI